MNNPEYDLSPILDNAEEALAGKASSRWFIDNMPIGLVVFDVKQANYHFALVNKCFESMFDARATDLLGVPLSVVDAMPIASPLAVQCEVARASGRRAAFEWSSGESATERNYSCHLIPRLDEHGNVYQIMGTVTDRTLEKRAERNLLHNALHDPLTELPNRILFQEFIEDALAQVETGEIKHCGVLIANVDRFKQINETLGHVAGDEFLIAFAARLKRMVRNEDQLARLSGDEFAFLLTSVESNEDVTKVANRIHDCLDEPFLLGQSEFYSSVSIGISTTMSSLPYPEDLVRDADFAMHGAKSTGRASTEIYQRSSHEKARSQFLLEIELRKAVDGDQLELYYQPLVDLETGKLVAFEALSRWIHPERGFIPPDEFIPVAEETGIIVDLGRWALNTACRQLKHWQDNIPGGSELGMTVNVSNSQFLRTNVAEDTLAALQESGLNGSSLRLELTETVIMENPQEAIGYLDEIKALGVGLALDDFGTGYSSLGSLQNFPLDIIKIDRSFVMDIESNQSNYKIVEIITQLSRVLGLKMVAEGVEIPDHVKLLKQLGCQIGQGYLFSRPVPQAEAETIIINGMSY